MDTEGENYTQIIFKTVKESGGKILLVSFLVKAGNKECNNEIIITNGSSWTK